MNTPHTPLPWVATGDTIKKLRPTPRMMRADSGRWTETVEMRPAGIPIARVMFADEGNIASVVGIANVAFIVHAVNAHDGLIAALQTVAIKWCFPDASEMPDEPVARCEWYAQRLLLISNASRAALTKAGAA